MDFNGARCPFLPQKVMVKGVVRAWGPGANVPAAGAAHRARWILRDSDLTERELCYLATGEFDPVPE
jgi:hypothetical protein